MVGKLGLEPKSFHTEANLYRVFCPLNYIPKVAHLTGFEPVTDRLEGGCSVLLSYKCLKLLIA